MALPLSRNETATGATPPKSATINDLQDGAIGRWHGNIPFVFPATHFTKYSGAAVLAGGLWQGIGVFICPLPFPPGTKITNIKYCYNRGGAGSMQFLLAQVRPIAVFHAYGFSPAAIAAGTGEANTDYSAAAIDAGGAGFPTSLLPANEGWTVQVDHDNASNALLGLIINAEKGP